MLWYTEVYSRLVLTNEVGFGRYSIVQVRVPLVEEADKAAQYPLVQSDVGTRWTAFPGHQVEDQL